MHTGCLAQETRTHHIRWARHAAPARVAREKHAPHCSPTACVRVRMRLYRGQSVRALGM